MTDFLTKFKQESRDDNLKEYHETKHGLLFNQDSARTRNHYPFADLVITSPPYDNIRDYGGHAYNNEVFERVAEFIVSCLKDGGVLVWNIQDQVVDGQRTLTSHRNALHFQSLGLRCHDVMIYAKAGTRFADVNRYLLNWEYMYIFSKGKPKTANLICDRKNKYAGTKIHGTNREKDGSMSRNRKVNTIPEYGRRYAIWTMQPSSSTKEREWCKEHPATFDVSLPTDHIRTWTNEGDIVVDPFMGSGTTAIAAIRTGRKYIGLEINEDYCKVAAERIDKELAQSKLGI